MKKSTIILLLAMAGAPLLLTAQDLIIKKNKTETKAKVIEITDDYVKYRDWDNLSGPIYNLARNKVFMIVYQNGKREFINARNEVKARGSIKEETPARMTEKTEMQEKTEPVESPWQRGKTEVMIIKSADAENAEKEQEADNAPHDVMAEPDTSRAGASSPEASKYAFAPVEVTKQKGFTKFADNSLYLGVSANAINQMTFPTVMIINDWFLSPSIAITYGAGANYNTADDMGYQIKTWGFQGILGAAYYLNKAFRINKKRAAVYVGAAVKYSYDYTTSDISDRPTSASSMSVFGRGGVKINITRRLGLFAEAHITNGDPDMLGGLSFSFVK
ncbi:porin family protein [Emticicia fluvialis]|uniref:porin family protein n=1 Tax=Emticicia fluvialis TaxID=2974474 RepID=UPI002166322B|nr:porin family protein [Emticicia fluvialis]